MIIVIGVGLIPIVGDQMDLALAERSVPPLSNGAKAYFGVMSFGLGMAMMWVYAFVRQRFGTSLRAALTVASFFWFFTYFWSNAALVAYGFLPLEIAAIGTVYGFVELVAATVIGARMYKTNKSYGSVENV